MRKTDGLVKIGTLMIAIAVVAGLLALPALAGIIVMALSIVCISSIAAQWIIFRRNRPLAACSFWVVAVWTNLVAAVVCVPPVSYVLELTFLGLLFVAIPTIAALGTAWIRLLNGEGAIPPRSPEAAGILVFVSTVTPILTLWTLWPLHMAFIAARPAMERLANQVAAGKSIGFPRQVGYFKVAGCAVDPVSGTVGLMIEPNPSHPAGFVRARPVSARNPNSPILGSNLRVELEGGWSYREDD
jgi:hypothetical protein